MTEIRDWKQIESRYRGGSLILGNGASINVCSKFNYGSLFEQAEAKGFITDEIKAIFAKLESKDFEFILSNIATTKYICEKLGITFSKEDGEKLNNSYNQVREALVKTVRESHPEHAEVEGELSKMANFMKNFRNVISLNYDLLVYWAMFKGNDDNTHQFKDCFRGNHFEQDFEEWRNPYANHSLTIDNVTLVFYPHGNLILSTKTSNGEETKITDSDGRLLSTILDKWQTFENTPLFVSEGDNEKKSAAINRSSYLNSIYNRVLKDLKKPIVVYGWSISGQDEHLLKAIAKSNPESVAVSIYNTDDIGKVKLSIKKVLGDIDIDFFDSNSPNCWNND